MKSCQLLHYQSLGCSAFVHNFYLKATMTIAKKQPFHKISLYTSCYPTTQSTTLSDTGYELMRNKRMPCSYSQAVHNNIITKQIVVHNFPSGKNIEKLMVCIKHTKSALCAKKLGKF